jgi:signal transduction histidine kinase
VPIGIIYYSHIPTAIIALLVGLFVYLKNKGGLLNKILLGITIAFSLWSFFDIILWTSFDSRKTMFFWSLLGLLDLLIFVLSLYFVYVYISKKDASLSKKIAVGILFLPLIILTPTSFNLTGFDAINCEAIEFKYFTNYYYFLDLGIFFWILWFIIFQYKLAQKEFRRQIVLLAIGIESFLFTFFITGYLSSLLDNFMLEVYGLFGMVIFMGFLAYLIVKFKAFDIKMLAAQALVISLVILIGSEFFFISLDNPVVVILTSITVLLATVFGIWLINSVKEEIKQKEELGIANAEIEKRNKKLKRANNEISERKEQLQKMADSLAIANDKLKKLDIAKTEFVSMASHQLRTPPTPIKGYSSMLLEGSYGELNEEQRKAVENIFAANNQQIAFVEDLLSVSRIESGSMKFVFEKFQITELCQEVINNLALKAKDKNLYLDYKVPAVPLPKITVDGAKIREVISNLVDNAIKYTLKGGITLSSELCNKKEANCLEKPHLRITVSDTGIGVPTEEIPYLFQKFSRGKDISRLNTGGTGLGLYVVKMITKANGGNVWIESPGKDRGTKFILELPLEQEKETIERNG